MSASILTVNAGSSSLKFALFDGARLAARLVEGKFERIGLPNAELSVAAEGKKERYAVAALDHVSCVPVLAELIKAHVNIPEMTAIGHRVVHGGSRFIEPQAVSSEMVAELRKLSPFAPEHLPAEIALIEEFGRRFPKVPQVACFDTAFHRNLPRVAKLLPIPRRYEALGVQRYGFHGLSYAYLMEKLEDLEDSAVSRGRIILAHLGNGASMAAVRAKQCIDTTMGFTPAAGLVMSTRSGDLDPGIVAYLARAEGMNAEQFDQMINKKSGLLGVSETSSDMRDLLQKEAGDLRAAEAVALFCYQAKKWIGALTAALGGIDTLVFAGGIGEHSPEVRGRICEGLGSFGIEIDSEKNGSNAPIISSDKSRATVRVIPTDEELFIAQCAARLFPAK
jgi:acetate kinase